jgi:predicted metalloendopeptidase
LFELSGDDAAKAASESQTAMSVETQLAQISRDRVANRDPLKRYNKRTPAELQTLAPHFDWMAYYKAANAPQFTAINVTQPEYFQSFDKLLTTLPVADIIAICTCIDTNSHNA